VDLKETEGVLSPLIENLGVFVNGLGLYIRFSHCVRVVAVDRILNALEEASLLCMTAQP
jgi:uncharacterized ParB-like nuclease family protein